VKSYSTFCHCVLLTNFYTSESVKCFLAAGLRRGARGPLRSASFDRKPSIRRADSQGEASKIVKLL